MSAIRLVNGRVLDPATGRDEVIDVVVSDGRITHWGREAHAVKATTRDVQGCWVTPGFVDTCARLREPGQRMHGTIASETRAARQGGFLHVAMPPDTSPTIDSGATVQLIREKARQAGYASVHVIGALTRGLDGKSLSNMAALKSAGCIGVGNTRASMASVETLLHCLEYAGTLGLTVFFSPEEPSLATGCAHDSFTAARLGLPGIPDIAETVALATQLLLVEQTGVRAHFGQLSCKASVELIHIAKDRGLPVTADVAMHHLHLTENAIDGFNSMAHVRPPLRSERDREALREGVRSGIIDAICSDHQPLNGAAKLAPFQGTEPGMSTLETLLPLGLQLVRANVLSETVLLNALTAAPAQILGITAGQVALEGAGILVIDPARRWTADAETLLSEGKNTPYLNREMEGRVELALT